MLALTLDGVESVPTNRFGPRGRFRVIHKSACDSSLSMGNPLVWPDKSMPPTAGQPLRVQWTTTPSAPFADVEPVYLLVSFGDVTPIELPASTGFAGCTLHVDPNPRNLFTFAPGSIPQLTQDGGRIWLHWTPPAAFAGHEMNMQLVTFARDANSAGWILSPGLELWIGSGG